MILENIWLCYGILFIISFLFSLILTPLFRKLAIALKIYDRPDEERKIHKIPTPYLGGMAVIISIVITLILAFVFRKEVYELHRMQMMGIMAGGIPLVILGLYDDVKKMSPVLKLLGQIVVATILYFYGIRIEFITNPFGGRILFGIVDRYIISVLWVIFFMNAINLIDGIDGLASGIVFISALAFMGIALIKNNVFAVLLSVVLAGAVGGFLIYNFPPATIFLGDVGSMFLGYYIAVLALLGTSAKVSTIVVLIVPVIILFVPVYDTIIAAVRRLMAAKYMFIPDREHLHHKLLNMGLSTKAIIVAIYTVTLFFALVSIILVMLPPRFYGPVALLIVVFIIFLGIVFRALEKRTLHTTDENNDSR